MSVTPEHESQQSSSLALTLIAQVLRSVDEPASNRWQRSDAGTGTVTVNGLAVPIIRTSASAIAPFFHLLGQAAGQSLFEREMPPCHVAWNKRFRRLGGRIIPSQRLIELSAPHYEACGVIALGLVYVHELIHWSLYIDQLPFGHTAEFKRRSTRIGMTDIRHEMPLPTRLQRPEKRHIYLCPSGHEIVSQVQFRTARCCLACCLKWNQGRADNRFILKFARTEWVESGQRQVG